MDLYVHTNQEKSQHYSKLARPSLPKETKKKLLVTSKVGSLEQVKEG